MLVLQHVTASEHARDGISREGINHVLNVTVYCLDIISRRETVPEAGPGHNYCSRRFRVCMQYRTLGSLFDGKRQKMTKS